MWYNLCRLQMETQEPSSAHDSYEPTSAQAGRASALRRFNVLYVYAPLGFFAAVAVGMTVFLLIVALNPPGENALFLISGLADVALVLALLPVLIMGAAVLVMIGYAFVQARKRGTAPVRQTQRLFWRMENIVGRLYAQTQAGALAVTRPFISLHGAGAYLRELSRQISKLIRRS